MRTVDFPTGSIPLAGFGRRALAFGVDAVLIPFGLLLALGEIAEAFRIDGYWLGFLIGFAFPVSFPLIVGLVLPSLCALSTFAGRGRTPGKALLGIAVRSADDGGPVGFGRLLRREISRGIRLILVIPSLLDHGAALRDDRAQTAHDRGARTIVVRTRGRAVRRMRSIDSVSRPGYKAAVAFSPVSGGR